MALDLTAGRGGLAALANVMQRWIAHLLGVDAKIEALTELHDANLAWYVGLDAEATKLGDKLWQGETIDDAVMERVIGIFRLEFSDRSAIIEDVRGEPVYLLLMMAPDKTIRM
jgi:hypothetical protein